MDVNKIQDLYNRALEVYKETHSDYDSGVCEGLKRVLEIIKNDKDSVNK